MIWEPSPPFKAPQNRLIYGGTIRDYKEKGTAMLFVGTFKTKSGKSTTLDEYLARRTQGAGLGSAPTEGRFVGIDILGEYWLQSEDPRLLLIFEAEENGPVLELVSEWEEYFDVEVSPAVKATDLMED